MRKKLEKIIILIIIIITVYLQNNLEVIWKRAKYDKNVNKTHFPNNNQR